MSERDMPAGEISGGPMYVRNPEQAWRIDANGAHPIRLGDLPVGLEWRPLRRDDAQRTEGNSP